MNVGNQNGKSSVFPIWNCRLEESSQAEGSKLDQFTVGNKYLLVCQGDALSEDWSDSLHWQLHLKTDTSVDSASSSPGLLPPTPLPENPQSSVVHYELVPLKLMKKQRNQVEWIVTSYKPGKYESINSWLDDGIHRVPMSSFSWEVKSVLTGQKKAQMVPPYGPFILSYHKWVFWFWGVLLFLFLSLLTRSIWRFVSRRRLLKRLEAQRTVRSPFNELNKDLRTLLRKLSSRHAEPTQKQTSEWNDLLSEMENYFRLFLVRKYLVPAQEWSDRNIIRQMRIDQGMDKHDSGLIELGKILREFSRLRKLDSLSRVDFEQMVEMVRKVADLLEKSSREKKI